MTGKYKKALVDVHNFWRNQIAIGNIAHYNSAVRMRKMSWNDDLRKQAELNVRTCLFGHDKCRKTSKLSLFNHSIFKNVILTILLGNHDNFINLPIEQ